LWPCGPKDSPLAFPFVYTALSGEEAFFELVMPVGGQMAPIYNASTHPARIEYA